MVLLRLVVLSAFLLSVASAYTVEMRDVEVYTSNVRAPGVSGARHYNAPAEPSGGPEDFDTLPYRYGFRLENHWDPLYLITVPTGALVPNAQFFRLCPIVPEGETDDYVLNIRVTESDCAVCTTLSRFRITLFNSEGQLLSPNSGCTTLSFNVKAMKTVTSDGNLWIRVDMNPASPDVTLEVDYGIHFWKDGLLNWNGATCQYPAAAPDVFSPCVASFNNIFDCDNGIYEPAKEQCDLSIATVGCTGECVCEVPFKPDGLGGCSSCGNGLLELPYGEVCDTGLDAHCSATCTGCEEGWVLNPLGVCSQCGNGLHETGEFCDSALSALCDDVTCTCTVGCVGDGKGGCTLCGNGAVDPGEYCDAADPACNADCTACARGTVARPREDAGQSGRCSLCGNGVVDAGETCDSMDVNCNDACNGCTRFHSPNAKGVCSRCGNGLLDKGEVCDSFRPGCKADCSGCTGQTVPLTAANALGECSACGNGVLDADEVCDTALDPLSCSSDCTSCFHPYVSVRRRCVTCGNGVRDRQFIGGKDEVCDAAQPGCRADCSACEAGFVPALDAAGSCTATCDNCCAALPKEVTSTTSSGAVDRFSASSAFFFLSSLLVALLF